MYQLYDAMKATLQQMKRLQISFQKELETLPSGSLYIQNSDSRRYYYYSFQKNGIWHRRMLKQKDAADAALSLQLKRRRFITSSLSVLGKNIAALNHALKNFTPYDPEKISSSLAPAYQDIREDQSFWLPKEPDPRQWAKASYRKSHGHPEHLIHETICGLMVRSKSEAMITDTLTQFGIPFRYEELLEIGEELFSPDFKILRLRDRKFFYWEHFGKMDDPEYAAKAAQKLISYKAAGIHTNHNLILTYEDTAHPLSSREIYDTISGRLL